MQHSIRLVIGFQQPHDLAVKARNADGLFPAHFLFEAHRVLSGINLPGPRFTIRESSHFVGGKRPRRRLCVDAGVDPEKGTQNSGQVN